MKSPPSDVSADRFGGVTALHRRVGNGENTHFLEDCWVGDEPLANRFPRLFALEADRGCLVADRRNREGWSWRWNRQLTAGRSLDELNRMIETLREVSCSDSEDRIPTRVALSAKGLEINSIMCPICGVESENHYKKKGHP
ncbi:hypothetical protein LXL04_002635 [Taraxacum kok-saghyz]